MESPYCTPNTDFSIMWHPAITSTPIVPSFKRNPGCFKSSQMCLVKPADVAKAFLGNKINGSLISLKEKKKNTNSKKATKTQNKKSTYFEVSSSDEEDCFNKSTLHGVKITLGKSTNHRIILDNRPDKKTPQEKNMGNSSNNFLKNNFESKDCSIKNKVRTSKINSNNVKCIKKKITDKNTKVKVQQNVSNKQINNNFIIKNKKKVESSNSKENIAVLNNGKINDKILTVKNKNNSKTSESFITNNVLDNKLLNDKIKIPGCTESLKNSILKEKNEDIKFPKSFQNLKTQTSKIPIKNSKKMKENGLIPPKLGKRKLCINNKASSPLCFQSKKKRNLSHQLFSDTKEQELIDSLDLTVVEPDEKMCASSLVFDENQSEACSAKSQSGQTSSNLKTKPDNLENDKKKILRQRKSPKKYWLPKGAVESEKIIDQKPQNNLKKKNQSPDSLKKKNSKKNLAQDKRELENQHVKVMTEISQKNSKSNSINGEKVNNSIVKTGQDQKELVDIKVNTENMVVKQRRTRKRKSPDVIKSTTSKVMRLTDKEEEKKGGNSNVSDKKKLKNDFITTNIPESTSSGVFKKLREASFIESKPGCFASEFRALKGFKCGILKVCGNSEISCKTAHKYSYFGGALIKNKLKMTIGIDEVELGEGDMAFIPPLTEWSAVNETESESIFYYWCCKLK